MLREPYLEAITPDPQKIYRWGRNSLPMLTRGLDLPDEEMDYGLENGILEVKEILNQSSLDGKFLQNHSTSLVLACYSNDQLPIFNLTSKIQLAEEEISGPLRGYYSSQRVSAIDRILKAENVPSEVVECNFRTFVRIPDPTDGLDLIVDFGFKGPESVVEYHRALVIGKPDAVYLERPGETLKVPVNVTPRQLFLEASKATQPDKLVNRRILMSLNQEGLIESPAVEFDDEQTFTGDVTFYVNTVGSLLRALYQEKGIVPPATKLEFDIPYDISDHPPITES